VVETCICSDTPDGAVHTDAVVMRRALTGEESALFIRGDHPI